MTPMTRRSFVESIGVTAGLGSLIPRPTFAAPDETSEDRTVHLSGDGIGLSPAAP